MYLYGVKLTMTINKIKNKKINFFIKNIFIKIKYLILFIIITVNFKLFSMQKSNKYPIENNPKISTIQTLKNKKTLEIVGVGPWRNLIGTYCINNSTATLQNEETKSKIIFFDVIPFFIIRNDEIMKNPIVKDKELIFFAQAKRPMHYSLSQHNIRRPLIAFWGSSKFEKN